MPPASGPGRVERSTLLVVVVIAAAANGIKALAEWYPYFGMWPYWAITYRHGFVRRGLAGTLFQALVGAATLERQQALVFRAHYRVVVALGLGIVAWALTLAWKATRRTQALLFLGVSGVMLSALFPAFGNTSSYFDVYLLTLAVLSAFLVSRGRLFAGAVLAAPGPLVHDEFLFLWLPVLVCVATDVLAASDRRAAAKRSAIVALPIAVAFAALTLHSHDALLAELAELPPEWRHVQVFELRLPDTLAVMWSNFSRFPGDFARALAFYGWPFVITTTCAGLLSPWRRPWNIVVAVLTTLAPCAILLVAWDLTRYLVWAGYGSALALFWSARARTPAEAALSRRGLWLWRAAVVLLVVGAVGGPDCYSYFYITYASYKYGGDWQRHTPAAKLAYAFVRAPNGRSLVRRYAFEDACPSGGRNVHIGEGCTVRMDPDAYIESPIWGFAEGRYRARLVVEPLDDCLSANGELGLDEDWRLAPSSRIVTSFDASTRREVSLDFEITGEGAAMGHSRVHVSAREGCFLVRSLEVDRR